MSGPEHVGGLEIRVDGAPLDPTVADKLIDARVQDDLMLPDTFQLRFRDPDFALVDGTVFDVGKKVELRLSPADRKAPARALFKGEVATLAPEFEAAGCVFVVRGYDVSQHLNRTRRSRTFQDMTTSDIAGKVFSEAALDHEVAATSDVAAFEQQSNETDWAFLWRLAERCGHMLSCVDGKLLFRPAGRTEEDPVRLEWGVGLHAFHPRATAVQQVAEVEVTGWDPDAAQRVSATASTPRLDSKIGLDRAVAATDGGRLGVTDRVVTSQGEADALAQTTLDDIANAWLEAEGRAEGDPRLRAGAPVEIVGVGQRFGGRYLLTSATHLVRGGSGYETRFRISGRSRRTLLDILTPSPSRGYGEELVIATVTNVDDPAGQNRVRVTFPALDQDHEGWWARVSTVAASHDRGLIMMPVVGDEVVVGFEQGDARRPIVLGSLFNGSARPGRLVRNSGGGSGAPDGSFNLASDQAVTLDAAKEMTLTTASGATVTIDGGGSVKVTSAVEVSVSAPQISVEARGTLRLSGAQVTIG